MDHYKTTCRKCGSKYSLLKLKLISSGKSFPYPKYIPMVKQTCASCRVYIKFIEQTPEIINLINEQLEGTPWNYEM